MINNVNNNNITVIITGSPNYVLFIRKAFKLCLFLKYDLNKCFGKKPAGTLFRYHIL